MANMVAQKYERTGRRFNDSMPLEIVDALPFVFSALKKIVPQESELSTTDSFPQYCELLLKLQDSDDPIWRIWPDLLYPIEYDVAQAGLLSGSISYSEGRELMKPMLGSLNPTVKEPRYKYWYELIHQYQQLNQKDNSAIGPDLELLKKRWRSAIDSSYTSGHNEWIEAMGIYCEVAVKSEGERLGVVSEVLHEAFKDSTKGMGLDKVFPRHQDGFHSKKVDFPFDMIPMIEFYPILNVIYKHNLFDEIADYTKRFEDIMDETQLHRLAPQAIGQLLVVGKMLRVSPEKLQKIENWTLQYLGNERMLDALQYNDIEKSQAWASMLPYYLRGGHDWKKSTENQHFALEVNQILEKIKDPNVYAHTILDFVLPVLVQNRIMRNNLEGYIEKFIEATVSRFGKTYMENIDLNQKMSFQVRRAFENRVVGLAVALSMRDKQISPLANTWYMRKLIAKGAADDALIVLAKHAVIYDGCQKKTLRAMENRAESIKHLAKVEGSERDLFYKKQSAGVKTFLKARKKSLQ